MAGRRDQTEKGMLSKRADWSSNPTLHLYQYQGFWYPGASIDGILKAQAHLQLSSSDIVLCSGPKTGTTWLKALAFSIVTRDRYINQDHPLLTSLSHNLIPYIEDHKARDPELPLLSTHMPYSALPKSITVHSSGGCKIVYICRNPKDAFVSLWHFLQKMGPPEESFIPMDKAFDLFCQGISVCGPYLDHVLEYWNASLNKPDMVLFLKYEEMMEDVVPHTRKLAKFMGYPFSEREERDGVLKRIVDICSFGNLSTLEVNKGDHHETNGASHSTFFRKAVVGDWRNYLTDEMAAKLDGIVKDKLHNYGLTL